MTFRFGPAAPVCGYREADAWIWCGSILYAAEERTYFMFASRWSRAKPFSAWVSDSEIVLARSERPEGPYRFVQSILPARGGAYWDGAATQNPIILKIGETYVLYYTGTACANEADDPARQWESFWDSQRIGVALAPTAGLSNSPEAGWSSPPFLSGFSATRRVTGPPGPSSRWAKGRELTEGSRKATMSA